MADALTAATSGMITQGASFIVAFYPILGIIGGIGLAMWILAFVRDYFHGA